MRKFVEVTSVAFCLFLATQPARGQPAEDDQVVKIEDTRINPTPETRTPPRYPIAAAGNGIEGWVLLEFFVETDGTIEEIEVLDADPPGIFEKASVRTVRKWRYKPALLGGLPVRKSTQVVMTFELVGGDVISARYKKLTRRAKTAMDKGNLDEALDHLEQLEKMYRGGDGDGSHLNYQFARYFLAQKDYYRATYHLRSSMRWPNASMTPTFQYEALTTLYKTEVRLSHFARAAETFQQLEERHLLLGKDPIHDIHQQVQDILDGSQPLIADALIYGKDCTGCADKRFKWRYPLSRTNFQIQKVEGEILTMRLSCGYTRIDLEFKPGMAWTLSDKWGACELQLTGQPDTKFQLAEF